MQILILAAGYGTRLDEYTKTLPAIKGNKLLLTLKNETVIQRHIRLLQKAGITDITVIANEESQQQYKHILKNDISIITTDTNHLSSFNELKATTPLWKNNDILILLGDTVYTEKALQEMLQTEDNGITIFGVEKPTEWCDKTWFIGWFGEVFAVKIKQHYIEKAKQLILPLRHLHHNLWNIPRQLNIPIHTLDECIDIDYQVCYEQAQKNLNKHIQLASDEYQLLKHIPNGGIQIDIGAAHGAWTQYMVKKADIVFAIEPDPRLTYKLLSFPKEKLWIFPLALSDKHEEVKLHIREEHRTGIMDEHYSPLFETKKVLTTTLDEIEQITTLLNKPITFIKIDTEGAEHLILKGAEKTIQKHKPLFVIEYHNNEEEVDNIMKQHNYTTTQHIKRTIKEYQNGLKIYQNLLTHTT